MSFSSLHQPKEGFGIGKFAEDISATLSNDNSLTGTLSQAAGGFAVESIDEGVRVTMQDGFARLQNLIENAATDAFRGSPATEQQVLAATFGGMMAGNAAQAASGVNQVVASAKVGEDRNSVSIGAAQMGIRDAMTKRSIAVEAYSEASTNNAIMFAIAYNYNASRQSEFGEAVAPTITIASDDVGIGVEVDLLTVIEDATHSETGSPIDFQRKNLVRALADPTILNKDSTKVIPVYRGLDDAAYFSEAVAERSVVLHGETIETRPYRTNVEIGALGLSQTDTLISRGYMDASDSLSPSARLSKIYLQFTSGSDEDVIGINVSGYDLANFTYSPQDSYRKMVLNFTANDIPLRPTTKTVDDADLEVLKLLATEEWTARIGINISGQLNLQEGRINVFGTRITLTRLIDKDGEQVSTASGNGAVIKAAIESGIFESYDAEMWRENLNARQRGQLIDNTKFTQLYNVPLRAPIAAIRPLSSADNITSNDVANLITATRFRAENDVVSHLKFTKDILTEFVDNRDDSSALAPSVLGVGRFYLIPTMQSDDINLATQVDSLNSQDRPADIKAALVNRIRDMVYNMYRDSEFPAAADALYGGAAPVPTVVIATDPVIAKYLHVDGELRTLGNSFNVKVVSSINREMVGKVYIMFSMDDGNIGKVNPLNFANMIWAPEMVTAAPINMNGATSKHAIVQPRYMFITNAPVMGYLTVTGIPDVLGRIGVAMDCTAEATPVNPGP